MIGNTGSSYYPMKLPCDVAGCKHYVVGQSSEHLKNKLKNHKKSPYCKGNKSK